MSSFIEDKIKNAQKQGKNVEQKVGRGLMVGRGGSRR